MTTLHGWNDPIYHYNEMGELLSETNGQTPPSGHDRHPERACAICGEKAGAHVMLFAAPHAHVCRKCSDLCGSALI
jgi:hypothetical protein